MSTSRFRALLALALCAGLFAPHVLAQTATEAAKADGKSLGAALRSGAQTHVRTDPTPQAVPNYSAASRPESNYFDNPAAMATAGAAAAAMHEGTMTVRQSMATRPVIPQVDLDATIARANEINQNPASYVSGMSVGGGTGTCVPLPPAGLPGKSYEQSCDVGYVRADQPRSCEITLDVTLGPPYIYQISNLPQYGRPEDQLIDAYHPAVVQSYTICSWVRGWVLAKCASYNDGECVDAWVYQLSCSTEIPGFPPFSGTPTMTRNESACAALAVDTTCRNPVEVCSDDNPQTRTVRGTSVTQSCWGWTRTYQCTGMAPAEDCSSLEASGCTFLREACVTEEQPCYTYTRVYACPVPDSPQSDTQYICDGDVYCINGACETIERAPNTEFKDAAVALNTMKEASGQFDPATLTLFRGTRMRCTKLVFGVKNCCVPRGVPLIGGCDAEDRALKEKREAGLCHYVGTYCSDKVLGVCVERKETHCCFESKLSRILQEQGRVQIGWPWASAKDETCAGFSVDQFSRLDLSRMDFSEVYAEFVEAARLPDELATVSDMQAKIEAYYATAR